jgi:Mor family transcriptional regulator
MEMDIEQKITINKLLRKYDGGNTFLLSLQKQLKSTKANKVEFNGKQIKVLSDKQYITAQSILK